MKKLSLACLVLFAFSACERVTHDPTYHDPVAAYQYEGFVRPEKANFNSDREYQDALKKYNDGLATKRGLGFKPASCLNGACNRVNYANANVPPASDAPQYSFQIEPNVPAVE